MSHPNAAGFLSGVIEGFYGQPWLQSERFQLFEWMQSWGLNTYFYCPKDDWKQRAIWRELYGADEVATLRAIINACTRHQLHFIYALSPGLDIRYSDPAELDHLMRRFEQMISLGCRHFALLFDDIPDRLDPKDLGRWGSLGAAQSAVTNEVLARVRTVCPEARFLFCPTPYCSRMASRGLGGENYLGIIGEALDPAIDILWTGPEIISREITVEHIESLSALLRRPPVLWDNLHANDYDGRRFYAGPYSGRPLEVRNAVRGILMNPNCEFALNFVGFRTFARFIAANEPWEPRVAYLKAIGEWLPHFETCTGPFAFDDLVLLADCFYLPYEDGTEAATLYRDVRSLLAQSPTTWGDKAALVRAKTARLRDVCARLAELRNRPLFYALIRRIWELREEMDLLEKFIGFKSGAMDPDTAFGSDFHLPETYRGSLVARLQRLLHQCPDGQLIAAELPENASRLSQVLG
jgi:protein O-GlcNAcase/histone acetyltransferase